MDRTATYKATVRKLVDEILAMFPTADQLEVIPILDEERGHYLIYNDGWYNRRRHYANVLHLEVKPEGKVYLRHDGTILVTACAATRSDVCTSWQVDVSQKEDGSMPAPGLALPGLGPPLRTPRPSLPCPSA